MSALAVSIEVVIVVLATLAIHKTFLFYRIRSKDLLRKRFPLLSLFGASGIILLLTVVPQVTLFVKGSSPRNICSIDILFMNLAIFWILSNYISRCYLLYVSYKLQVQASVNREFYEREISSDSGKEIEKPSIWLLKHRRVMKYPVACFLMSFIFFWTVVPSILLVLVCRAQPTQSPTETNILYIAGFLIDGALAISIYALLASAGEALPIQTEISRSTVQAVFICIISALGNHLGFIGPIRVDYLLNCIFGGCLFYYMIVYPRIVLQKQKRKQAQQQVALASKNLVDHLKHTHLGHMYFRKYLELEFSVENLLFWMEVEDFRREPTFKEAIDIYETYVKSNADLQININYRSKVRVVKRVTHICGYQPEHSRSSHVRQISFLPESIYLPKEETKEENVMEELKCIFDEAQEDVANLMHGDSWPRYLISDEFGEWLALETAFLSRLV